MKSGAISNKTLVAFESEISVLTKIRHRYLVSLLGCSTEGLERILVYEYMPQGALSRHLFHWKNMKLEPLSWKWRLNIALDVASAKVSDFGFVKLVQDGGKSIMTRVTGTFGYVAPEYAGNYLFSLCIHIYIHIYTYIFIYTYIYIYIMDVTKGQVGNNQLLAWVK
ncbi:putative protein kinase RLK-Pelle-LRR-IX family [Helianthus debilis subsp. tardiflorus]